MTKGEKKRHREWVSEREQIHLVEIDLDKRNCERTFIYERILYLAFIVYASKLECESFTSYSCEFYANALIYHNLKSAFYLRQYVQIDLRKIMSERQTKKRKKKPLTTGNYPYNRVETRSRQFLKLLHIHTRQNACLHSTMHTHTSQSHRSHIYTIYTINF